MNEIVTSVIVWFIAFVVVLCSALYLFLKKRYRYWKDRGIPGPEPEMFYGNIRKLIQVKVTDAQLNDEFYKLFRSNDYIGYFQLWKPVLLVRDLDLARRVMEKDSDYFSDRFRFEFKAKSDSVLISLFSLDRDAWKSRRTVFNRLFTPRKLKEYLEDIERSMPYLLKEIDDRLEEDAELATIIKRHAVRTNSMVLYGLDVSNDEKLIDQFVESANMFVNPPTTVVLKAITCGIVPWFFKLFQIPIFPKRLYDFNSKLAKDMMSTRIEGQFDKSNLLDTLMKMMDGRFMDKEKISFDEAVGHIYMFFQASFDTTIITISHALVQLAWNPEIQEKARREVDSILAGSKKITIEHLAEMHYIDAIFVETLRMFPPVGVLNRVSTRPYKVDDNFTIPQDTIILIPASSIHNDPKYFPEPEMFRPERFYNKEESNKDAWLPFGAGPRICIGMRLGKLGIKLALARILSEYVILPSCKMELPMKFNPKTLAFSVIPVNGFWVKMKRRSV